ncbi:TerC family protein [Paenibacillus sp. JX-17]|uniref:TerC family protein n=1 Tax=Paenibacillus lacisoli TaxID=3064525 RepID=A0ABT9C892_9BACL|nr:TerC family protein [Paenibacillus sp. JX-17]MDO7905431.1 TerC family protein [Paenibacillus sp. JX-17]
MDHIWLLTQILMINLVLSGDNAVVIAMASNHLPAHQRKKAVWWGSMGAVILRCILTFMAVLLLGIPYIQAAGGLLLLWIAFKLLYENSGEVQVRQSSSTWKAVQTILAADFVMSLDNVLAIAALAKGDLAVIIIGIAISIPIVVWGSNLIGLLLRRYPILVLLGSAILAYTAGEMLLRDPKLGSLLSALPGDANSLLPLIFAGAAAAVGMLHHTRRRT